MESKPPPVKPRILVIDDDPSTLQLVHSVLDANGHAPLMATSAEQALAILGATPDVLLVISDINMPGMDGIVFLERLGTEVSAQATPGVIFLTAHARMDFAVAALRLGALDFLTKPVRPKELLQAVSRAVDRVQRNRASQSPQLVNLAQQAEALAAALKGWSQLPVQKEAEPIAPAGRKAAADNPRDFALLGMEQVRRLRRSFPPLSELDDVAWHLLLELASAEQRGQRLSVSALCVSIDNVSSTTALRRVQDLVKGGHITRVPDPADARRDFVTLDSATQAVLDQYLERVGQELAAVANGG
ncbi:response regulator [Steroidobacter sp. S1-65]|uniref:Response regulator n=1 Tax=Steroidobacter gossypii TaxID=2805490 RepID=A0ABS1WZC5_9GAMM|nr:response regulator [Steroidobacter gossypii]MBM0106335.1 response regulator [Steroidobacter gossypii]